MVIFGESFVQSVGGDVIGVHNQHILRLSGEEDDLIIVPPEGRGFSPNLQPVGGPAGLAILTAGGGPTFTARAEPTTIERAKQRGWSLALSSPSHLEIHNRTRLLLSEFCE